MNMQILYTHYIIDSTDDAHRNDDFNHSILVV